jgi:hypothetical protein
MYPGVEVREKFNSRVARLVDKMKMSQTPVPGFIIGLSGTDSMLAFHICYEACARMDMAHRVYGIHYVGEGNKPGWFQNEIMPFMREQFPEARLEVKVPLGGNQDQQRWADIHLRSLNLVGVDDIQPLEPKDRYWVVGTMNATEAELGTYSILSTACSVQPIRSLWKTEVIRISTVLEYPPIAIEMSHMPDCFCGRDELAAQNIEMLDLILRYRIPHDTEGSLIVQLDTFIRENKEANAFKSRIPYVI